MKNKIKKFLNHHSIIFTFLLVFFLFFLWLMPKKDLLGGSGDTHSVWVAITTYYSNSPVSSYVMYKGVLSIFPNVWLYELAKYFKVDNFLFIKLFHSLSFAYITTVGMPYIVKYLLKKRVESWKKIIFSFSLFMLWKFNHALDHIMIDLSSLTILVIGVSYCIKIIKNEKNNFFNFLILGFFLGLLICGSGQYQLSFYTLIIFILISYRKMIKNLKFNNILFILVLIIGIVGVVSIDKQFNKNTLELAQKNDEFFLTKKEWFNLSLSGRNMLFLKYANGPTINNNRGRMIGKQTFENFEAEIESGRSPYSSQYFLKLVLMYPLDFLTQWLNRFFLSLSLDNGNRNVLHLIYSFSLFYVFIVMVVSKIKKIEDVFKTKILVVLSFVLPSLVPLIFHVEMRYFLSIQILIFSTVLLGDILWKNINIINLINNLLKKIKNKTFYLSKIRVNYTFVAYIVYLLICFSWYASLYNITGVNKYILFSFL